MSVYNVYSEKLKQKYGEKVYKLPVNLNITCPNRDGTVGEKGCIFCGDVGAGFESLNCHTPVKEQLIKNMEYIGPRYGAKKFIAFFQNFTGTYMPAHEFEKVINESNIENIVEVCVSTRPDCVFKSHLDILKEFSVKTGINVSIELGLQTANYKTLSILKRGHGLAEFINAVNLVHQYGFEVCTHIIADLPWDSDEDVVETARILSALKVEGVKLHSLYIVKGTECERMYLNKEFELLKKEDYIRRVILFLRNLNPNCTVERIIGRAPEKDTVTANFDTSWWKIKEEIESIMENENYSQGDMLKLEI